MSAGPDLRMRFRVPLDRFDLEVDCGSDRRVVGLFGPSGAGKTTWIETVAGLRRPASGFVSCGGECWVDMERGIALPPERRGVGYVPQDRRLFPHLDVRGNLLFGAGRESRSATARPEIEFDEVVEVLELGSLLDRPVDGLSGGEGQRVALGRALLVQPRLLLLDEPLASLDAGLRRRILPFLGRIRDRFELPMLLVSHQPFELQVLCDEVFVVTEGRVLTRGTPAEVFTDEAVLSGATPFAGGFENVLVGVHERRDGEVSRVRLGSDDGRRSASEGPLVACPAIGDPTGEEVVVTVPARDVLLADRPVEGISARNIFPSVVSEVRNAEGGRLVFCSFGNGTDDRIVAELTAEAVEELGIARGREVHVLVKSHSIATCPTGRERRVASGGSDPSGDRRIDR